MPASSAAKRAKPAKFLPLKPKLRVAAPPAKGGVIIEDGVIFETDPYVDRHPPDCQTCQFVRTCTRGRMRLCRWCAGDNEPVLRKAEHRRNSSGCVKT